MALRRYMEFWQTVHWFVTSKCNLNCMYCFKPNFTSHISKKRVNKLAEIIAANPIKKVIFTGGEPLLVEHLFDILKVLKDAGIYTIVHTNAMRSDNKRIKELSTLVDDIAIPIDTTKREVQAKLRRKDCLPHLKMVYRQLQNEDIAIGIHTVATSLNISDIPLIYNFLQQGRFDYWRIYEFNEDLVHDRFKNVKRFKEVRTLKGISPNSKKTVDYSDGGILSLFARFLLMEEYMCRHNDPRIQFIGVSDYNRRPYFFLDSQGDVHFSNWFSQGRRAYMGNIIREGFQKVKDKAVKANMQGPLFDEEAYVETMNDSPLWARAAWEGNYDAEELEQIDDRYKDRFLHLRTLYFNRQKRLGQIPKKAKLTIFG